MTLNRITIVFGMFAILSYALSIEDEDFLSELLPPAAKAPQTFRSSTETGCKSCKPPGPEKDKKPVPTNSPSCTFCKTTVGGETDDPFLKELCDMKASCLKEKGIRRIKITEIFFHDDNSTKIEPIVDTPPDLCDDPSIDAVVVTQDGRKYMFKGEFYWMNMYSAIVPGYPRKISDDWDGLEGNLDAALTLHNGKTYFFKGERCWRFVNRKMDSGYPKLISEEFSGIPDDLDAAFVWGQNSLPYFFKGNKFWCYNNNLNPPFLKGPSPVSDWKGVPADGVDAAYAWGNETYFYKGQYFYTFMNAKSRVVDPYPGSIALDAFSCPPE